MTPPTVLVADDDRSIRTVLTQALGRLQPYAVSGLSLTSRTSNTCLKLWNASRFVLMNFGALVVYLAYPMAPPWLASEQGYLAPDVVRITGRGWRDIGLGDLRYTGPTTALTDVWRALRASMRSVLEQTSLADVAGGSLPEQVSQLARDYLSQEDRRGRRSG